MNLNSHYMWRVNPEIAMLKFIEKNVAISVSDHLGRIIYANNRFCDIVGCEERELIGSSNSLFKSSFNKDSFYKNLWETIENGNVWKGLLSCNEKKKKLFSLETTIVPLKDEEGNIESYLAMYLDVSKSKNEQKQLEIQH